MKYTDERFNELYLKYSKYINKSEFCRLYNVNLQGLHINHISRKRKEEIYHLLLLIDYWFVNR